jgi:hypothetical protein
VKPVKGNVFKRIVELVEKEGFEPIICRQYEGSHIGVIDDSEEAVYNHVLRKPLSTDEIMVVYGLEGLKNAERLVSAGILDKKPWFDKVFFKARQGIDQYNTIG